MAPIKTFSLLVFCAVGLTRAAFPVDEIHWTITGQTSVTFDWRGPESTIAYGLTPSYGQTATAATPAPLPFSSPGPFWEARLAGLQQNTLYHYSIGAGPDHTFHTPPPRGSAGFTIYVEGDVGDGALFSRMPAVQRKGGCPPPSWSAYRAMHHGAIKLRFTPTAIEGQVTCGPAGGVTSNLNDITCAMGSVIDTFTVFNPPVLSVPGPAPRPFGFDRVGPNPATGQMTLSYTLENGAPATLELLDPAGRRIMSLSVGAPGPGPRSTLLRADALRSPGLYFVRLRQSGRVAVAKVAVTATGH